MATGDQKDVAGRLVSILPPSWFPDPAANKWSLLQGFANVASWCFNLIAFAKLQTRISTATGVFLDLIAFDYFGRGFLRKRGQPDNSFSIGIKREVLRPRQTRAAIIEAVNDLTQTPVTVFEPWNAGDSGGFGRAFAFNEPTAAWGSNAYPYTIFVTAVEPAGAGIPGLSGFNDSWSGFGAGAFFFADLSTVSGLVTNQDIFNAIERSRAAGVTCWVNIGPPPIVGGRLDVDFYLDNTPLS